MRALIAFVAGVVGAGLLLRGVADWGFGFLCAAAALAVWRAQLSPLRRVEAVLAITLVLAGAVRGHSLDGAIAAAIAALAIELMRIM